MNIVERAISLLAPHHCIVCGVEGFVLCEACQVLNIISPPSRCYRCHAATRQSSVCSKCRNKVRLEHVWIATYYQDVAKDVLHKLKFERANSAAQPTADSLNTVLPDLPVGIVVTHIPTANSRVRARGYDQAKLIAKIISKTRGWQHQELLVRRGRSRQVGSSRVDRFKHIEKALMPIRTDRIKGAHILVIDDVTTTGATLEAAAKILKNAGAKKVDAAAFAQPIN